MYSKQVMLTIFMFFAFSVSLGVSSSACSPPEIGNWKINASDFISCVDKVIEMRGNITINESGVLQMNNVTLIFNTSNSKIYRFTNYGSLEIYDSNISKIGNGYYDFISNSETLFTLERSNVSYCGNNSGGEDSGFYIEGNESSINNDKFTNCSNQIKIIGSDNSIKNNSFSGNSISTYIYGNSNNVSFNIFSYESSVILQGANFSMYGNTFNETGINLTGTDAIISGNDFSDDQINIMSASGSKIVSNTFTNSVISLISDDVFFHENALLNSSVKIDGSESEINNNTFSDCETAIILAENKDAAMNKIISNTITDCKTGLHLYSDTANSNISYNTIEGNSEEGHSVNGIFSEGKENVFEQNSITGNVFGIRILGGFKNNITNSTIKSNDYGIFSENTTGLLLKNNTIDSNKIIDINTLSTHLSIDNTNYTTRYLNWTLILKAYDANGTQVAFSSSAESNNSLYYRVRETSNPDYLDYFVPEIFENTSLDNPIIKFNPYEITATNTVIKGFNVSIINITSDLIYSIHFNGTAENESDNNETEEESFSIVAYLPRNRTYISSDFINNKLRVETRSSVALSKCWYYLNDNDPVEMNNDTNKSFYYNIASDDLNSGGNEIYFVCELDNGIQNNTEHIFFTAYPEMECIDNSDCSADEFCNMNNKCEEIDCGCGYASNHECVDYDCCSNNDCESTEMCSNHNCVQVSCECPEKIKNHICDVPTGYCCKSTMCKGQNEVCDLNLKRCVKKVLKLSLSETEITLGESITVVVKDESGSLVEGVEITASNTATGKDIKKRTDDAGSASIDLPEAGTFNIVIRKSGFASAQGTVVVREGFNIIIVIVIIIIILGSVGAFIFLKSSNLGSSEGNPITMNKLVSGRQVSLSIKNNSKKEIKDVTVNDQVPKGAFISANIQPRITDYESNTDNLLWHFPVLKPKQEIIINYNTHKALEGFSVQAGEKEYISG